MNTQWQVNNKKSYITSFSNIIFSDDPPKCLGFASSGSSFVAALFDKSKLKPCTPAVRPDAD